MKLTEEQCKRILAKQVGDEISNQMSKPFDDIDWDIVNMCEHVLEIFFLEVILSKEEIDERIQAIIEGRKFISSNSKR